MRQLFQTRPPSAEIEAAMALFGDEPQTVALRTGISLERLEAHFYEGGVLNAAEVAAFRRAYGRFGVFAVSLPGFAAVAQFTGVVELRAQLRRHERWPEPWPEDTFGDRLLGRLWRWWLRWRGLGERIGRDRPETVAAYAATGVASNGERIPETASE